MIEKLIKANRSYRRFNQDKPVNSDLLKELVNLARLSASAANLQPLKYIISSDINLNEQIFSTLGWAAYLKDWKSPKEGEKPAAYIIILLDTEISNNKWSAYDCGIASQSILLAAAEKGLGGCMIGSVNKKRLAQILNIKPHLEIMLVIALGNSAEKVIIEAISDNNDIKYFRDEKDVHHVPKRSLEDIIIKVYN
ncbi:MAG: nitroreductase family protein [Deltaproteobacteria bacterium]|nr:nitroreductase family protein [Deltaproteobacteria bacterium]